MTEAAVIPFASDSSAAPAPQTALKVLIADDSASDRMILSAIVRKAGFEVIAAVDGRDALAKFAEHAPDILLLDVMMPGLDGKRVAQQVRASVGQEILPIIFVTSLSEPTDLAECLDVGGDDFLPKPYNPIVIKAKLSAYRRLRMMHAQLRTQAAEIERNNTHLIQEQEVAKAVFDRVIHTGGLSAPNIRYMLSPLAVFNGDVLLSAFNPAGGMHVLLADFTGHGLPAAIGAIPLAETFYSMTRKGFEIEDILAESNAKLCQVLPTGVFSCVAAASLDFRKKQLRLWQGGLPDCMLLRANGTRREALKSRNLPLGILPPGRFNSECQLLEIDDGDRLLLWSDGIVEAQDARGELFGESRIEAVLDDAAAPDRVFDDLKSALSLHIGDSERSDDITLVELSMVSEAVIKEALGPREYRPTSAVTDVAMSFEFAANSLRNTNPLPLVIGNIMEISGLRYVAGEVQTILAELFSNALEHGVLGLSSELKRDHNGFALYYHERSERLKALSAGFVRFDIRHEPSTWGGVLTLRLTDSGAGFDHEHLMPAMVDKSTLSGRGVTLLNELCRRVRHLGAGNATEVEFEWRWPDAFVEPAAGSAKDA